MDRSKPVLSRRGLFRAAGSAAVTGSLICSGVAGVAQGALLEAESGAESQPVTAGMAAAAGGKAAGAPVVVVGESDGGGAGPRARAWPYIAEILRRAGVFFDQLPADRLAERLDRPDQVVLLAGHLRLKAAHRDRLARWVNSGGSLIGIGGTSGLDEVFGVASARPLAEGWIKLGAQDHPLVANLRSSLHVFGGFAVAPAGATAVATVESGPQGAKGSAILENRFGRGRAILLAPDLIFSVVHIQQGLPVFQDGKPSPDGSAPIDDGELKAEDGLVLDWQRDRTPMEPDKVPVFLEPVSDELREIILRSIFHLASQQGIPLPLVWYWPNKLPAVGHISHDTDGNDPTKAVAMLEVVERCKLKSTWCTLYPGGYPRGFYRTLKEKGYEIALHYDARTGEPYTRWSKDNLILQRQWLLKEAGLREITSNKNHYTRWEGRLDFLRWCQEVGIRADQTRGPSKQGTIGFPLGGSQPYFPLDDEADPPRLLDVLEVNMLTQDLVVVCPRQYGRQLVDSVLRHHGVAHFLFHPSHIQKPHVAETLADLVAYGRRRGLQWWTNRQILQWETLRRGIAMEAGPGRTFTLRPARAVQGATLVVLRPQPEHQSRLLVDGRPVSSTPWTAHGFTFDAVTLDLAGPTTLRIL